VRLLTSNQPADAWELCKKWEHVCTYYLSRCFAVRPLQLPLSWCLVSSLPAIIPALVCLLAPLHSRFSGSLNLAHSHSTSLSLSLYHSLICHLISSAIRPTIVQSCLRISFHWVFTHAWLAFTSTLNLLTHLRKYFCHSHFILWGNLYRYR